MPLAQRRGRKKETKKRKKKQHGWSIEERLETAGWVVLKKLGDLGEEEKRGPSKRRTRWSWPLEGKKKWSGGRERTRR